MEAPQTNTNMGTADMLRMVYGGDRSEIHELRARNDELRHENAELRKLARHGCTLEEGGGVLCALRLERDDLKHQLLSLEHQLVDARQECARLVGVVNDRNAMLSRTALEHDELITCIEDALSVAEKTIPGYFPHLSPWCDMIEVVNRLGRSELSGEPS